MPSLLLSATELSRGFDRGPLFEHLHLEVFSGERIGLVGPNGCGKTTLLKTLAGLEEPDRGSVNRHAGARVAMLEQVPRFSPGTTLREEARSALEELLAAQTELEQVATQLAHLTDETQRKTLEARYDRLHEQLAHNDAFTVEHRVEGILHGLGFPDGDLDRAVDTFSGGQKNRLLLARLLLAAPDVMLLDEPTNHLDIATVNWLESYLLGQPQGMLLISHDRAFLDRVATRIIEIGPRGLESYPGNFTHYWRLRRERHEMALKAYEKQQEEIERQEDYIRRVNYGQLHKQAASRQKQLDKLERLDRPVLHEGPRIRFGEAGHTGETVLEAVNLSKKYSTPLFTRLSFQIRRGSRIGIVGPNGCGKSTLLKILLGHEQADSGEVRTGAHVKVGYYDQQLACLPAGKTLADAVRPPDQPTYPEQRVRDLLGAFGLEGAQVHQKVDELSGGEKSRVAMAALAARDINTLVLDEPTNHLDLWACDSLEEALRGFPGTVLVVSHDRWFLNRVTDMLIVFDGKGDVEVVHGNWDLYERLVASRTAAAQEKDERKAAARSASTPAPATLNAGNGAAEPSKRKRKYPFRKVTDIEADIDRYEEQKLDLEAALEDPETYRDGRKALEVQEKLADAQEKLTQLYDHWEEAMELNPKT